MLIDKLAAVIRVESEEEEWQVMFNIFSLFKDTLLAFAPDHLFHLAALTDLEYCETHPDETFATNALAVESAVHIANELDITMAFCGHTNIQTVNTNILLPGTYDFKS